MPTDTTVIEQIIDPVAEDVAEIEALEGNMVHISGTETITGLKTFSQAVTAPSFIGAFQGTIAAGTVLLGDLDLDGFALLNLGGSGLELLANKGIANGYAPLGATSLVPAANLGTGGAGLGDNFLGDDGVFRPISAGAVSFGTQLANLVFAGPGSGAAAAPAFRLMVAADIPTLPQSKITSLESDLSGKVPTTRTITEGAGLAGNTYDLSANRTLALGTPTTLLVSSANSASGTTHSHAITSSSNPGTAASLLASDASGRLTVTRLTLTDYLLINALTANLYLKDTSTGLQVATTGIITPQDNNIFRNTSYTSGVDGWNIDDEGNAEFNNIRARGEIAGAVFKVSEIAATAGTHGVFYSASTLDADFTTPATTTLPFDFNAKNSDAGGILFAVNDKVRFKAWTGAGISDAWATITARVDHTTYTTYTATLESGSTSATFTAGTAVVDYGPTGTGFITLSADGTVGSSPNLTMATHAGSPWSAQTTLLRLGNLNGSYGYAANVYGLGIGDYVGATSWLTVDPTNGVQLTLGGSALTLSASGIKISTGSSDINKIKWVDAGTTTASLFSTYSAANASVALNSSMKASNTTGMATVGLTAFNDIGNTSNFIVVANNSLAAAAPNTSWTFIGGGNGGSTYAGLMVGDVSNYLSLPPTHMLDVYGTGWFQGNVELSGATAPKFDMGDTGLAHGVTDFAPTTSFFHVDQAVDNGGRARVFGFSSAAGTNPLSILGVFGSTDPTDTVPAIQLFGGKRTGTTIADLGATETVLQMGLAGTGAVLLSLLGSGALSITVGGALKTVEVGAADSGGVGYKMLRVAN